MTEMIKELEEQFQQFEQSIGINDQNFGNKFIFQQLKENLMKAQGESDESLKRLLDQSHNNLFLDVRSKVQGDIDGFTREQQNMLHFYGASIISDACQYLQLPITTCVSAQTIFHRFYTRCSFFKHDLRDVAMGSVFLAGKAQETIKKPRDLAYVFDQIFKIEEGYDRPVPIIDDKSYKFNRMKQVVQDMEREILKELGFELYQITWNEQPHRLMYFYINLFKPNPSNQSSSFQNLTRTAFNYLNDSYKTNLCLYLPFQMIVACCIYLAFRKTGGEMPRIAWWTIMETSLKNLKLGAGKIQYIYNQFTSLPKFVDCLEILNNLAKQKEIEQQFTTRYHELPERQGAPAAGGPSAQSSVPLTPMQAVQEAIAKSKLKLGGQSGGKQGVSSSDKLQSSDQLEKKEMQEETAGVTSLRDLANNKDKQSKFSISGNSPSRDRRKRSRSNSRKKTHKRKSSRSHSKSRDRNKDRKDKDRKHTSRHSRSRDRRDRSNSHKDKRKRSKSRDRKKDKYESKNESEQLNGKSQVEISIPSLSFEVKNTSASQNGNDQSHATSTNGNGTSGQKVSETPEVKQDKHSPSNTRKDKSRKERDSSTSKLRDHKDEKERDRKEEKERERDNKDKERDTRDKERDTRDKERDNRDKERDNRDKERENRDRDRDRDRDREREKDRERDRERDRDRKDRKKSKSRSRSHHKKSKRYNNSPDERDSRRKRSKDRKKEYKRSRSNSKEKHSKFSLQNNTQNEGESTKMITPSPPQKTDKFSSIVNEKSNDFTATLPKDSSHETNNLSTTSSSISSQQTTITETHAVASGNGKPTLELSSSSTTKNTQLVEQIRNLTGQAKPQEQQTQGKEEKKKLDLLQSIKSQIQQPKVQTATKVDEGHHQDQSSSKPTLDLKSKLAEKFKQYQPQLSKNHSQQQGSEDEEEEGQNEKTDNQSALLLKLRMMREQNKQKASQSGNQ